MGLLWSEEQIFWHLSFFAEIPKHSAGCAMMMGGFDFFFSESTTAAGVQERLFGFSRRGL